MPKRLPVKIASCLNTIGLHWKFQGSTPIELRKPPPKAVLDAYRTCGLFFGPAAGRANKGLFSKAKKAQLDAARRKPRPARQSRLVLRDLAQLHLAGSAWSLASPGSHKPSPGSIPSSFSFPFVSGPLPGSNPPPGSLRIKINSQGRFVARFTLPKGRVSVTSPLPLPWDRFAGPGWSPLQDADLSALPTFLASFLSAWRVARAGGAGTGIAAGGTDAAGAGNLARSGSKGDVDGGADYRIH